MLTTKRSTVLLPTAVLSWAVQHSWPLHMDSLQPLWALWLGLVQFLDFFPLHGNYAQSSFSGFSLSFSLLLLFWLGICWHWAVKPVHEVLWEIHMKWAVKLTKNYFQHRGTNFTVTLTCNPLGTSHKPRSTGARRGFAAPSLLESLYLASLFQLHAIRTFDEPFFFCFSEKAKMKFKCTHMPWCLSYRELLSYYSSAELLKACSCSYPFPNTIKYISLNGSCKKYLRMWKLPGYADEQKGGNSFSYKNGINSNSKLIPYL